MGNRETQRNTANLNLSCYTFETLNENTGEVDTITDCHSNRAECQESLLADSEAPDRTIASECEKFKTNGNGEIITKA
jgi:hypothetical protein